MNTWSGRLVVHGLAASIVLAAAFTAIAVSVHLRPFTRPLLLLAIATSLAMWVAAQDLGELATGHATDPNSGPLLARYLLLANYPKTRASLEPLAGRQPLFSHRYRRS